jgi:hypothetical protein
VKVEGATLSVLPAFAGLRGDQVLSRLIVAIAAWGARTLAPLM